MYIKSWLSHITLPLITAALLFSGCSPHADTTPPSTAALWPEETVPYERYQEESLQAQTDFDRLTEELFCEEAGQSLLDQHFLFQDPAALGIPAPEQLYAPVTLDAMQKSRSQRETLSAKLAAIEPALLTEEQKLTLRILQSFLKTEAMSDGLELYAQPLAPTIGLQAQLPILLSEYRLRSQKDIEDYLQLLSGIDEFYAQILSFEQEKANAGLMSSDTTLDHIIDSCESYILVPGDNFMIDTFQERLEQVPGLSAEQEEAYLQKHNEILESDFLTAYELLIDGLEALKGSGTNSGGLCGFPQGKEYYQYLVFSGTGTSCDSMETLINAIEEKIHQCLTVSSQLLQANPALEQEFDTYQFREQTAPDAMTALTKQCSKDFPALSQCNYTFKEVPSGLELSLSPAFYVTSPIDAIQENVIYLNPKRSGETQPLYPIIAHEGYPGHLYQTVFFHSSCRSNLRKLLSFLGYSEGWATYVEMLSYEFDNGLKPEMGKLLAANSMATLGLYACLDYHINYDGWNKDQVREYLSDFYNASDRIVDEIYDSMVENPANYLSYFVGGMEFQNMREAAEQTLGASFDALAFHTFLMELGEAPFDVIQPYFSSWLMEQKQ